MRTVHRIAACRAIFLAASTVAAITLFGIAAGISSGIARADSAGAEATALAKQEYREGLESYKAGFYEEAIVHLKKAYLLKHLPAFYFDLAKTYQQIDDVDHALRFYRSYLTESPAPAPHRQAAESAIAELERRKQNPAETAPRKKPPADEPKEASTVAEPEPAPAPIKEPPPKRGRTPARAQVKMPTVWTHSEVDAAPPGLPMAVRASAPVQKGVTNDLYYRSAGDPEFTAVRMVRQGPEVIGIIPGEAIGGKSLQYYIEAKRKNGEVVNHAGSAGEPNIVMVDPNAPQQLPPSQSRMDAANNQGGTVDEDAPVASRRNTEKAAQTPDEERAPLDGEPAATTPGAAPPSRGGGAKSGISDGGHSGPSGHGLRWAGLGVLLAGAAIGGAGGGIGFSTAGQYAANVMQDGQHQPRFVFNDQDPTVPNNDLYFQGRGQLADYIGIGSTALGGAMVAAGLVMIIVDAARHGEPAKPATKKQKKRGSDSPELRGSTEPAAALSPVQNLLVMPSVSTREIGLNAGFSF